tara:strand:+ start:3965 stop:4336 length:372 start_codon:yes stop_codon:yes gene_type:complete
MKYISLVFPLFALGCNLAPQKGVYFQAYDPSWDMPEIKPIFNTEQEALDYAERNSMDSGHDYKVRIVNYRYEIRHKNDARDDLLYNTRSLRDARSYLHEYGMSHNDLFLYDLKTGELIETSTP